jgi:hypothetical protein
VCPSTRIARSGSQPTSRVTRAERGTRARRRRRRTCTCSFARWITQSRGRTLVVSSCHARDPSRRARRTPPRRRCECGGVGSIPGATRTRFTPTVLKSGLVAGALPRCVHLLAGGRSRPQPSESVTQRVADAERHSSADGARTLRTHELTSDPRGRRPACIDASGRGPEPLRLPSARRLHVPRLWVRAVGHAVADDAGTQPLEGPLRARRRRCRRDSPAQQRQDRERR